MKFDIFTISLHEYWNDNFETLKALEETIQEFKDVLTEHYNVQVDWEDPLYEPAEGDTEIAYDSLGDIELSSLQLVAAKLELDGTLDGLDFNSEEPWDCEIFDRIEDEILDEYAERSLKRFPHLLSYGNSKECFILPIDFPHMASLDLARDKNPEDDDCSEEHEDHCCGEHECCCGNPDCHCGDHDDCDDPLCCCEKDDGCIDVSSLIALRRELDDMAKQMGIDPKLDIKKDNLTFDEDDMYYHAKIAWYLVSSNVNQSLEAGLPLICVFNDEDDDFDEEDDDFDEDEE